MILQTLGPKTFTSPRWRTDAPGTTSPKAESVIVHFFKGNSWNISTDLIRNSCAGFWQFRCYDTDFPKPTIQFYFFILATNSNNHGSFYSIFNGAISQNLILFFSNISRWILSVHPEYPTDAIISKLFLIFICFQVLRFYNYCAYLYISSPIILLFIYFVVTFMKYITVFKLSVLVSTIKWIAGQACKLNQHAYHSCFNHCFNPQWHHLCKLSHK